VKRTAALRNLVAVLAVALPIVVARSAEACSVCVSATEETRQAYYVTTVLMMLLPFLLLGGLGYWLRRAARAERARVEQADSLAS
jgi:uncharacterized membrane protein